MPITQTSKWLARIASGVRANIYNQAVTLAAQLAGVPILLHAWGTQVYGEWLIVFALPTFLALTDLGLSQSAGNDMAQHVARGEHTRALAVFQSLCLLITLAGLIAIIGVTMAVIALPIDGWLHLQAISATEFRWVLWLFAAETFLRVADTANHAAFRASGEYAVHTSFNGSVRLLQHAAIWLVAISGGGLVAAALVFCGIRMLSTPAVVVLLLRRHRWIRLGYAHARSSELKRLWKPAMANLAMPLGQALHLQGMTLAVAVLLGPLAVVTFSTLRTITRTVVQVVLVLGHAAEPELATAYGAGDRGLMRHIYLHTLRVQMWLAGGAAVALTFFGGTLLALWTGGDVAMDFDLFLWLLGSALLSVTWYGSLAVLRATNTHLRAATVYVLGTGTSVVIAVCMLLWTEQVAAAGASLLLIDLLMAIYTLQAAARMLQLRVSNGFLIAIDPRPMVAAALRRGSTTNW